MDDYDFNSKEPIYVLVEVACEDCDKYIRCEYEGYDDIGWCSEYKCFTFIDDCCEHDVPVY